MRNIYKINAQDFPVMPGFYKFTPTMKKKAASGKAVWLLLILVPLAVYCRVLTLDFINIDDYHFIVKEKMMFLLEG